MAKDFLEEIIDDILLSDDQPHKVIIILISELIEYFSMTFLLEDENITLVVKKIREYLSGDMAEQEDVRSNIVKCSSSESFEIQTIINVILETVFGTGIDFLYVIKN